MTVFQPKRKGTKLGHRLKCLAEDPQHATIQQNLLRAAGDLDRTCITLGVRGERIKTLRAYQVALYWFQKATGDVYDG